MAEDKSPILDLWDAIRQAEETVQASVRASFDKLTGLIDPVIELAAQQGSDEAIAECNVRLVPSPVLAVRIDDPYSEKHRDIPISEILADILVAEDGAEYIEGLRVAFNAACDASKVQAV